MIEIVDTKLRTLDLLPSCGQPLRLEGVGPVGGLGVVVNVILPAPHGPAHAPAGGDGRLVAPHLGQVVPGSGGGRHLRHLLQDFHLSFVIVILWSVST